MSDKEILAQLQQLDQDWQETEPAQEGSFEPLPEADYELIVIDAEMAKSSAGNVGLNVQFEVTQGDHEGRYVYHTFWLTKPNLKFVKRDLAILGYEPASVAEILKAKPKLMHKKVVARLGQETYDGKTFAVVRVIDGDTLDVDRPDGDYPQTRVRLWGVDTPETKKPETPVQHFGPEATAFTRGLCDGMKVRLELEPRRQRDNHGRLLAWVYLPDGRLLNRLLVAQGYAYADPRYQHHLYRELRRLQALARKAKRGLWKDVREKDLPYYYCQGKHRIELR